MKGPQIVINGCHSSQKS